MEELKYFFSYARKDSEFVLRLAKELRTVGANVWLDQLDVLGGQHWDSTVEEALKSCKGMIAVLSPESVASDNVMDEVSYALDKGKLVVPILICSCEIPLRLRRLQYIDFAADYDTGFSQLLRALGIEQPAQAPESAAAQEPVVQKPPMPKKSELTPDAYDHSKPGVEIEKAVSKSKKTKVLAAICIVTLIVIISIGVFLKYGQPKAGDVESNSIGMKLVYIPAGEFTMGSPSTEKGRLPDEGPQHKVIISKGFWMGQTEVTQDQYTQVMQKAPWSGQKIQVHLNCPASSVTLYKAVEFCENLSKREKDKGRTYRLPTEAEWEYACRAGKETRFSFGNVDSSIDKYAWFKGNAKNSPRVVMMKKPNPWSLFDMHGNVTEWCSDCYGPNYYSDSNSPSVDPKGPSDGTQRCGRGGSFWSGNNELRCSFRGQANPNTTARGLGFRVVRSQP